MCPRYDLQYGEQLKISLRLPNCCDPNLCWSLILSGWSEMALGGRNYFFLADNAQEHPDFKVATVHHRVDLPTPRRVLYGPYGGNGRTAHPGQITTSLTRKPTKAGPVSYLAHEYAAQLTQLPLGVSVSKCHVRASSNGPYLRSSATRSALPAVPDVSEMEPSILAQIRPLVKCIHILP